MESNLLIRKAQFEDEQRIAVFVPNESAMIEKIKKIPNRRWSPQHQCWHFPYDKDNWAQFKSLFVEQILKIQQDAEPLIIPFWEMVAPPKLQLKTVTQPQTEAETIAPKTAVTAQTWVKPAHFTEGETESQTLSKAIYVDKTIEQDVLKVRLAPFWKGRLRIDFIYRKDWKDSVKSLDQSYWHSDYKCWSVPHSPLIVDILTKQFGEYLDLDVLPLVSEKAMTATAKAPPQYKIEMPPQYADEITNLEAQMTLKRMAVKTIKTYKNHFKQFLYFYNETHPAELTYQQIVDYMLFRIQEHKISESDQNTIISAIKCYYELVLKRERTYYAIQRPKKPFKLPNVFSEQEIKLLFTAVSNVKHKCILLAIYSGGLRLSEVINLRKEDLRKDTNCIFIKGGKGKKDRFTLLSPKLLAYLDIYYQHYQPIYWLFEGAEGGQYSTRSVQLILRDAVAKSGVNPFGTVHTLRHSFATHLVNRGTNLKYVKDLLGHENLKTTEIYLHLTGEQLKQVQSPLDNLDL